MPLRTAILRTMIVALVAACACAIVFVILPAGWDRAARFIGTSASIAAACALALPALPKSDSHAIRWTGTVWLGMLVAEVVIILTTIWTDGNCFGFGEPVMATAFLLPGTYAFCFTPLRHLGKTPDPFTLTARLAVFAFAGSTLTILAVWFAQGTGSRGYLLFPTWWVLMAWTVIAAACLVSYSPPKLFMRRAIGTVGIAATTLTAAIGITMIHSAPSFDEKSMLFAAGLTGGLAGACAVLGLVDVLNLSRLQRGLALALAAGAACTGGVAAWMATVDDPGSPQDWSMRIFAACLIADGCLGLTLAILFRLGRKAASREWAIDGADIYCPRCGKRSHFTTGIHPCPTCAFQVLVAFRDERCAKCRHELCALAPGHPCPECGTVPEHSATHYLDAAGAPVAAGSGTASVGA